MPPLGSYPKPQRRNQDIMTSINERNKALDEAAVDVPTPSQTSQPAAPQETYRSASNVRRNSRGTEMYVEGDFDSKWMTLTPDEAAAYDRTGRLSEAQMKAIKKRGNLDVDTYK